MLDDEDDPLGIWDGNPPAADAQAALARRLDRALAVQQAGLRDALAEVAPEDFKDLRPADAPLEANEARTLSDGLATIYKGRWKKLPLSVRLEWADRHMRAAREYLRG